MKAKHLAQGSLPEETFKLFLGSFRFYTRQMDPKKLEQEIKNHIKAIYKEDVEAIYLGLYYALYDWFLHHGRDLKTIPVLNNRTLKKMLDDAKRPSDLVTCKD